MEFYCELSISIYGVNLMVQRMFCARTQGFRICTSISLKWSCQSYRCILYLMPLSMTLFGLKTARCDWYWYCRDIKLQIRDPCVLAQKFLDREIHTLFGENLQYKRMIYLCWKVSLKKKGENHSTFFSIVIQSLSK